LSRPRSVVAVLKNLKAKIENESEMSATMKKLPMTMCVVFALLAVQAREAGTTKWIPTASKDVYLLVGQSNMAGRGELTASNRIDLAGVWMLNASNEWTAAAEPIHFDKPWSAGAGLGASFAASMKAAKGADVGLVPCAMGGTGIDKWRPGEKLFTNAVVRTRQALELSGGRLRAILWHQGESDCAPKLIAAYPEKLRALVAAFRRELGDVPFVAGELGRQLKHADAFNRMLHETLADIPDSACVSSEGLVPKADNLHFDTPSLRTFGLRYADTMLRLRK